MRPEYDLRGGVRGKYFKQYQAGTTVVVLDPDVATVFQNSEKVNRVLRLLIDLANKEVRSVRRKSRPSNCKLGRFESSDLNHPPLPSGRQCHFREAVLE